VVIDRDPVEFGPEAGFHLLLQIADCLARVGKVYSAERDVEDGRAFLNRGREDRHQFHEGEILCQHVAGLEDRHQQDLSLTGHRRIYVLDSGGLLVDRVVKRKCRRRLRSPRSDASSQGCATMVTADGTSLAAATKCSYFT
jgi:hypothetical protein